jgi:hypothetical protein
VSRPQNSEISDKAAIEAVFMHFPPDPEKIRQIEAHLLEKFPNTVVFVEPMEGKAF